MSEQLNNDMLLAQIEQGSIDAFDSFYQRYYSFVMQICKSIVQDYMEAEEICHDVFLEIIKKAHSYNKTRGSVDAWIAIIAKSRCKDWLRKKHRRATIFNYYIEAEQQNLGNSVSAEAISLKKIEHEALHEAVKQLPVNQQRALVATYFQNQTQQECATHLQVSLGTVKSWIRYGVRNLRNQLKRVDWNENWEGKHVYDQQK